MTEEGKYIYCIVKEKKLPRREPKALLRDSMGINNREVSLVHYKDISAVISNTPVINLDSLDKKELTKYVAAHQKVNEEVMKGYDVVPMAFGIIAPSGDEVLRILERAYLQFKTALKNTAGKTEFAVQVWWNPQKILQDLANADSEIQKLKQERSSKKGIGAMTSKLKLGKLVQQKTETLKQTFIKDIRKSLAKLSYDSTSNKLTDDEMIANFSFLIDNTEESELDKKMQELGKKYEEKLRFKYTGPMPPYSFTNINLSLGNFEVVDEARKLLQLPQLASFDEIKKAYYAASHKYHPDKYQGDLQEDYNPPTMSSHSSLRSEGASEQMKKINEAYSILVNYCESCDELMGAGRTEKYSFKKEDVENSIIIK